MTGMLFVWCVGSVIGFFLSLNDYHHDTSELVTMVVLWPLTLAGMLLIGCKSLAGKYLRDL